MKKQKKGRSPYKYKGDYTMLKWDTDIMKFRFNCMYACISVWVMFVALAFSNGKNITSAHCLDTQNFIKIY